MTLSPECPHTNHRSFLWSLTDVLLEQGLAGYAGYLDSDHISPARNWTYGIIPCVSRSW